MSLTTVVTVHCDECGEWEHTDARGPVAVSARARRRAGWVITKDAVTGARRDYCPRCAAARAAARGT